MALASTEERYPSKGLNFPGAGDNNEGNLAVSLILRVTQRRGKEGVVEPCGWMKGTWVVAITLGVTAASCTLQSGRQSPHPLPATEPTVATTATMQAAYGQLPLSFEANQGQSAAIACF